MNVLRKRTCERHSRQEVYDDYKGGIKIDAKNRRKELELAKYIVLTILEGNHEAQEIKVFGMAFANTDVCEGLSDYCK